MAQTKGQAMDSEMMVDAETGEIVQHRKPFGQYRQGNGKLQLGFKLQRPDEAVRIVLDGIVGQLEERFPGVVFVGEPGV